MDLRNGGFNLPVLTQKCVLEQTVEGDERFASTGFLKLDYPGPNPLGRSVLPGSSFDPGSSLWNLTFRVLDEFDCSHCVRVRYVWLLAVSSAGRIIIKGYLGRLVCAAAHISTKQSYIFSRLVAETEDVVSNGDVNFQAHVHGAGKAISRGRGTEKAGPAKLAPNRHS